MPEDRDGASAPTVSVVIACFNGQETLGDQLAALVRQDDPPPFEVIVADNGSTDGSAAVARRFGDRLDLRVIDASEVKGPGHARNRGVAQARAELIAFCDADDIVADDWLRQMTVALAQDDFVAGRVDVELLNTSRVRRTRAMRQTDGLQRSGTAGGMPHAGAGNMGLTRQVFLGVDGFDEGLRCLQDSDLCWRIQLAGTPLAYHRDVLLHTRLRSTLRTMARQGWLYGRSYAQLESRYSQAGDATPSTTEQPARSRLGAAGTLARVLRDAGAGGLVWQIAWHLGHRRATRRFRDEGPPPLVSCLRSEVVDVREPQTPGTPGRTHPLASGGPR